MPEERAGGALTPEDEAFVRGLRERIQREDGDAELERNQCVAERVLSATTRSSAHVRRAAQGSQRSSSAFGGKLGAMWLRWPQSTAARLVAASLLVHLAALPILGWYAFRDPEPKLHIGFDLPRADHFADDSPAELPPLELPNAAALLDEEMGARPSGLAIENARRRARFCLHSLRDRLRPFVSTAAGKATGIRGTLLTIRAQGVLEGDWSALPDAAEVSSDGVARALLAETLLDRAVLGQGHESLRTALMQLEPAGHNGPVAALEREAARRALDLDYADGDLRADWHAERWYEAEAGRWADPFTVRWFELLDLASRAGGPNTVLDGWVHWAETSR